MFLQHEGVAYLFLETVPCLAYTEESFSLKSLFPACRKKGVRRAMQQVEMVSVAGCVLWTARQGNGPALVCCHGGPGLWDYLEPVAAMLDDLETIYRYDQRSCGRSTGGPPYDVATAIADLDALREHWGLSQWIVLGHSWGATLALAYGLAHPARARALIYLSGTGVDASWHAEYRANRAGLLRLDEQRQLTYLRTRLATAQEAEFDTVERAYCELAWSTDIADRPHARELARQLFVDGLHVNFQVNELLGNDADRFTQQSTLPEQLATLLVPTLVIHGERDPRPTRVARQLGSDHPVCQLRRASPRWTSTLDRTARPPERSPPAISCASLLAEGFLTALLLGTILERRRSFVHVPFGREWLSMLHHY